MSMSQGDAAGYEPSAMQHTLRASIGCVGVGLHSGVKTALTLHPAEVDSGIRFVRKDLDDQAPIEARFDRVCDTTMCTAIGQKGGAVVGTIEHLMAALAAMAIDNVLVEIDGPEVPIMDGSAQPFIFLIECAGLAEQNRPRRWIEILKPVTVTALGKSARLEPRTPEPVVSDCVAPDCIAMSAGDEEAVLPRRLQVDCRIEFDHPLIKSQSLVHDLTPERFKTDIADARTFGFAERVEELWSRGLALGGSLNNAVVVSQDKVLNDDGLRFEDEFVRHKVLDCIGDLYLAGAPIIGRFVGDCAGHAMHNKLLRALFADPTAWRVRGEPDTGEQDLPLRHAASA
ncbi:MAG: UDP-3-O-acyl-N-acetylglucosamine deacetylase [Alphaproteobacteria bacterium]|nr:UDP-3-O-acyl-N-acetylglucosamine deacetylase [Alphaproteobacteria bacterium]